MTKGNYQFILIFFWGGCFKNKKTLGHCCALKHHKVVSVQQRIYLSGDHGCIDCSCCKLPFQGSNNGFSDFNGYTFLQIKNTNYYYKLEHQYRSVYPSMYNLTYLGFHSTCTKMWSHSHSLVQHQLTVLWWGLLCEDIKCSLQEEKWNYFIGSSPFPQVYSSALSRLSI